MDVILKIISGVADMAYQAGIYVLIGILAAGLVEVFISRKLLTRHLGGRGFGPILWATLIGAPLPLCSCSVLPTAFALRKKGASRGATVSFLISTPETSFDSVAITWGLMGPVMAIVRPVAAVATALAAGLAEMVRSRHIADPEPEPEPEFNCPHCASGEGEHILKPRRWSRFWRFVAIGLGDEIGPTLALGLVLAGVIGAFVNKEFFEQYLGNHVVSMLVMLAVGLPLYVCATASTPMAAMLVLRGLNPGAALVFLLVGPATNLATVLTVGKMFGKLSAALYVGMIAAMSLAFGFALDALVGAWHVDMTKGHVHGFVPHWVQMAGAVVLAVWLLVAVARWTRLKLARSKAEDSCCEGEEDHK